MAKSFEKECNKGDGKHLNLKCFCTVGTCKKEVSEVSLEFILPAVNRFKSLI